MPSKWQSRALTSEQTLSCLYFLFTEGREKRKERQSKISLPSPPVLELRSPPWHGLVTGAD